LSDELDIVGAGVEVLVGEVEVDLWGVGSGRTNNAGSGESRETGSGVEDSRHRCALVIGARVMWEREIGHSELRRMCPQPLSTFLYTRSATGAHHHQLVDAPDQGARSNGPETWSHAVGRPLESIQQGIAFPL
jgi:hypothetical protein